MWLESAEGQGSTFHFTLSAAALEETAGPAPASLAQLRVLIVEDGVSSRLAIAETVRSWGMIPVEAQDSAQALAAVNATPRVDAAIVDRQLPGLTGAALAAELRQQPGCSLMPMVFLNFVGAAMDSTEALPVSACLNKPLKPAQLQAALLQLQSGTKSAPQARQPVTSRLDATMSSRLPLRILLTDDNAINQKVALRLLLQLGYKADTASTGLEAVRALEQKPYDVILMDVQMPEMDGLEATRHIRQRQRESAPEAHFQRSIVIIAMTANAMQGDREKCVAAGMDDYLPKPVRPEALQAMLEQHAARLLKSAGPSATTEAIPSAADTPAARSITPILTVLPAPAGLPPVVEQPPVDMDRLNEFAGGNLENFNELVGLYIKQTTEQLEKVRAAISEGNAESASRVAHSCAGASATCGMDAIVPLLREVEYLTQEGKLSGAAALLPAIDHEFDRLMRYLELHKPIALAG